MIENKDKACLGHIEEVELLAIEVGVLKNALHLCTCMRVTELLATPKSTAVLEVERKLAKLDLLKNLILDDVPHQYQKRLLEALQ